MLAIRMVIYLLTGVLVGQGLAVYDAEAGTVTFRIEDLPLALSGLAAFVGTFVTSRIAKARGGAT